MNFSLTRNILSTFVIRGSGFIWMRITFWARAASFIVRFNSSSQHVTFGMQLNNNVDADFVWIISGKYYDIAYKIGSLSELFCMSNLAYSNTNQVIETIYMPIHLKYSLLWATGASTSLWRDFFWFTICQFFTIWSMYKMISKILSISMPKLQCSNGSRDGK